MSPSENKDIIIISTIIIIYVIRASSGCIYDSHRIVTMTLNRVNELKMYVNIKF